MTRCSPGTKPPGCRPGGARPASLFWPPCWIEAEGPLSRIGRKRLPAAGSTQGGLVAPSQPAVWPRGSPGSYVVSSWFLTRTATLGRETGSIPDPLGGSTLSSLRPQPRCCPCPPRKQPGSHTLPPAPAQLDTPTRRHLVEIARRSRTALPAVAPQGATHGHPDLSLLHQGAHRGVLTPIRSTTPVTTLASARSAR